MTKPDKERKPRKPRTRRAIVKIDAADAALVAEMLDDTAARITADAANSGNAGLRLAANATSALANKIRAQLAPAPAPTQEASK